MSMCVIQIMLIMCNSLIIMDLFIGLEDIGTCFTLTNYFLTFKITALWKMQHLSFIII